MNAIEEIERKLSNYENQYISENKLLIEKVNEYMEKEQYYKEQILSLFNQVNELKLISSNHNKKSEFDSKFIKEENIKLKEEYDSIKRENNKLKKELNSEKIKNEMLLDKYNKLSYLYNQKEKENLDPDKEENKEKNKIISYCNNTISIFIKWIETNLITLNNNLESNSNLYNDYIKIEKNNLFIFDELKESLSKAKTILDNKYTKINLELEKEKQQLNNIQKENYEFNNILENIYNHLYQEIFNEKYFDINNNDIIENRYELDTYYFFNEIENMINKTFELLKKIKESSYDKSLDRLIEDNTQLSKEIEIIKSKAIALYNDNKILYNYKNELEKINGELKQKLSNVNS